MINKNKEKELKELSADEVEQLAKEMQEKKKSDIVKVENKDENGKLNKKFRKTKGLPMINMGKFFGKIGSEKKLGKEINWKREIEKELEKTSPNIENIKRIFKKIEKGKENERIPIKSPFLILVRADNSMEWHEGVKAGTLEITRSDESLAYINLEKGKLITSGIRNIDDRVVQGWVAYENDHVPFPHDIFMDSKKVFQNAEEIMSNKKDVQAERINAKSNMIWMVFIGIALIIGIVMAGMYLTGSTFDDIFPDAQEQTAITCNGYTHGLGQLSLDEAQIIKNFRIDIESSNESGGGEEA